MSKNAEEFDQIVSRLEESMRRTGERLASIGARLTKGITLPSHSTMTKEAAKRFEESFAGVRGGVVATESDLRRIAASFREMAKRVPIRDDK